eukprot:scaffold327274_cov44-Prasinocladus_malaysianus.AAC.1
MDTARACGDGDNEIGRDVLVPHWRSRRRRTTASNAATHAIIEHIRSRVLPVRVGYRNLEGIITQQIRNLMDDMLGMLCPTTNRGEPRIINFS